MKHGVQRVAHPARDLRTKCRAMLRGEGGVGMQPHQRVLFDPAAHDMRNKGNNALLEVAMERVRGFWPQAACSVVTLAPRLTRTYLPNVEPVDPIRLEPFRDRSQAVSGLVPTFVWKGLLEAREFMWHRRSAALREEALSRTVESDAEAVCLENRQGSQRALREAISRFNLFVASGGGYMCDSDKRLLLGVFDRLEAAAAEGVTTAMVGQGVGPLDDPELRARARDLLPRVDLIFVRERRVAVPLLRSLGVEDDRLLMTGDDAIEMAYRQRPSRAGNGIGVSVRVSSYTAVEKHHLTLLREVVQEAARKRQAVLVGVPISGAHHESDSSRIAEIVEGYADRRIERRRLEPASAAITRTHDCRLMVTGTYHGAIFALGQGIPVVAIARSQEYMQKLVGLHDEYGSACEVISVDKSDARQRLSRAIHQAWEDAEALRPGILRVVEEHIEAQRCAYSRLHRLVSDRARRRTLPACTAGPEICKRTEND